MTQPEDPATLRTTAHSSSTQSSRSTPPSATGKLDWLKPVIDEGLLETIAPDAANVTQDDTSGGLATTQFVPSVGAPGSSDGDELATTREFAQATQSSARRLGRFVIAKELGAGAFGKVYLGRDPQLDRDVAIKVAKVGLWSTDEDRTRFLREARAAAQLRHPHIVPVYEFGTVNDSDYIAYQYVKGTTLREELKQQSKFPIERAVAITIKIGDALHYAHGKKIVHRDVKPENVLLDEEGEPHVADFGCARREDAGALLTVEGQVMGTPAYMSPEQAGGQAHLADGRSDVWSLGVMLEEMLTGQRPFRGTLTEILISIRDHEPKPIRQHNAGLPKDLETIVQKCLAKRPDERFPTAGFLVEELQRWQRGEPILSRRISVWARTWRWAQRNPTVAMLLTGIVTTALLAALLISLAVRGREMDRALQVAAQLIQAEPRNVQVLLKSLNTTPYPRNVAAQLRDAWIEHGGDQLAAGAPFDSTASRAGLGLLAVAPFGDLNADLRTTLLRQMLAAPVEEFLAIRDGIGEYLPSTQLAELRQPLWIAARGPDQDPKTRLRAYAALAAFDATGDGWDAIAEDATDRLLAEPALLLPQWLQALSPARQHLRPWLLRRFESGSPQQQEVASAALAELFADDDQQLAELLRIAQPQQLRPLVMAYRDRGNQQTPYLHQTLSAFHPGEPPSGDLARAEAETIAVANAMLAEFMRGNMTPLVEALRNGGSPSLRTELLERLPLAGIEFAQFGQRVRELAAVADPSPADQYELAGWILAMGGFGSSVVANDRIDFTPTLAQLYESNSDPGVHAAIDWTLRQWDPSATLPSIAEHSSPAATVDSQPSWRETRSGVTMVALGPVDRVTVGSPLAEQERFYPAGLREVDEGERQHEQVIGHRFEIASREVTAAEYLDFELARLAMLQKAWDEASKTEDQANYADELAATMDVLKRRLDERTKEVADPREPARDFRWSDAVAYCRWFTEQEGLLENEQCYPSVLEIALADSRNENIEPTDDHLQRSGYRLPTMLEWEYAARGLTETPWPWGLHETHRDQYSWSLGNAPEGPRPVGLLKPNRFGIFDASGNVDEWNHDRHEIGQQGVYREIRGGSHRDRPAELRPARRKGGIPWEIYGQVGLRIARTVPTASPSPEQ